ncbi:MAG TPA: hypothetical protein VKS21_06655, partial [Spirochaetota bacterium]|nr:hypothetical protein [Spirochaetota bacterium]
MDQSKQFLYMVNLNRFRIVIISLIFISLFAGFFFVGLAVGVKSSGMVDNTSAGAGDPVKSKAKAEPADYKSHNAALKLNKESELNTADNVPSYVLLEKEKADTKIDKKKQIKGPAYYRQKKEKEAAAVPADKKYYIQLMVTRNKKKAFDIRQKLRQRNYKGYV